MSGTFCFSGIADEYDERTSSLSPSTFNTDSIESISRKISCLNSDLSGMCPEGELVIDTYVEQKIEENEEDFGYGNLKIDYKVTKKNVKRESLSTREKEKKDLNRFAGVFSLRTVMGKDQDPLNIQKHNLKLDAKKKRNWAEKASQIAVSKKPMLVELHTFPGFKPDELTPLPAGLVIADVLNIVTSAQKDLKKKPGFKKEFKRIFFTYPSQAVIQDIFWWFFLERYQPCPQIQRQLFSRVACNYVKLVFTSIDQRYKETFFKRYPSLVSQAVYTVFCRAFPTSYRQFDNHFKQELADLVYQWVVGIKPVRRCWQKWPLPFLEPEGMNKEDEIHKNVSQEFIVGWSGPVSEENDPTDCSTLDDTTAGSRKLKYDKRRSITKIPERVSFNYGRRYSTHAQQAPVATASDGWLRVTHDRTSRALFDTVNEQEGNVKPTHSDNVKMSSSLQSTKLSNMSLKRNLAPRESCHVGKGAEFQKVVFNLYGQSPLVRHFLKNRNLAKESGTSIFVQRTEIERLPPIDTPTYQDVIKDALKSSHELEKQVQSLIEQSSNERITFGRKQKQRREEFRKKETEVLSRQKEVKRMSDLILLQLAQREVASENDNFFSSSISTAVDLDEIG